jgi:DNA-binding NtrC family response regulator
MKILHYNDEEKELHKYLADRGHENVILPAGADVFSSVRQEPFDAAFIGLHPHGLQLIRLLHRKNPDCLVTMITADRNARVAVDAMKLGAFDYLLSPLDFSEVERTVIMMAREQQGQDERRGLEGQLADAQTINEPSSLPFPRQPALDSVPIRGRLCDITAEFESKAIWQALRDNQGNLSETAKTLAISRTTLYAKMQRYGIPNQ